MRLIDADDFIARLDHVPMVQDAIKKAMDYMPTIEEHKMETPCDLCRYNPPSSGDGKPCSYCPAEQI